MDIIDMARELGKLIQQDERYLKVQIARQQSDEDEELQNLIGELNLKRLASETETGKEDCNTEKLQEINSDIRRLYGEIMKNEHLASYNSAKTEFDNMVKRVLSIITKSADGEDPMTADYSNATCSGNCSSCGGCH